MVINALDSRGRTVLSTETSRVDFLGQHPCTESIIRTLRSNEVLIEPVRVVKIDDERTATVCRVPATAAASLRMVDIRARLSAPEGEADSCSQDADDRWAGVRSGVERPGRNRTASPHVSAPNAPVRIRARSL
jgi:hypothetical protein